MAGGALMVMLLGLVTMLAFRQLTPEMWSTWCYATAGIAAAYLTSNVVAKKKAG